MAGPEPVDVIVAGGGPVGLLAAAELARFGARVTVVEPLERVSRRPKAGTVHARAVQSLVRRGYLDGVAGLWEGPDPAPFHYAGLPVLRIAVPPGEPVAILKRSQADLEDEFEARLRERGGVLLRGHRVVALEQSGDGVRVAVRGPGGDRVLRSAYLVGADGARGVVRDLAGITADVSPPTVSAMMGLVRSVTPDVLPRGWHRTPRGWTVVRAAGEDALLIRTLETSGPPPQGRETPPDAAELEAQLGRITGTRVRLGDAPYVSRFSDVTRVADHYRRGRVLLAGDAAHLHFPIGGQGLSAGVLDALNLAWKLARVVAGAAPGELLDTYEAERRPAALHVVEYTRAQLGLMREGREQLALCGQFTELMAVPEAQAQVAGRISGQDLVCPPRCGRPCGAEGVFWPERRLTVCHEDGSRTTTTVAGLLRSGGPVLIEGEGTWGTGAQAKRWPGVRTVRVATPLDTGALVLRPDGHVAWTPECGELDAALERWFGPPG
ncbi:FAD-dependent monooxygenase [Streptomyces sp. NPDC090306]|uniref:FAD-dependent monooxygenase n=1 Tax=Streptomyces sp. NPDC090306 TaxID=3365961 RepID=UPI0038264075